MEVGRGIFSFYRKNQVDGLGEDSCISGVCGKCIHTNIFISKSMKIIFCETGGESTYVKYNQVCENEFFATTQKGMDALVGLKKRNDRKNIMKSENYSLMNLEKLNIPGRNEL